jgi:F-type H+-transporting ATPase subunit b
MLTAGVFLLPNGTFFVELLIVFVLLYITSKFILPPLTKAMDERDADVRSSIEAAESARAEAAEADEERRAVIEQGRVEAREILSQAQAAAEQARSEALASAQGEYDRIVSRAAAEVAQAKTEAIDSATPQLGTIVMGVVERVIGREVNPGTHQDLIDEGAAELRHRASAATSEVTT